MIVSPKRTPTPIDTSVARRIFVSPKYSFGKRSLNNSSTNIQTLTARDNTVKEIGRKITKIVKKDGNFYVSNIYDSIAQAQRDNNISNIRISIKKPVQFSVTNNCWFRDYKNTDYIDQETQLY